MLEVGRHDFASGCEEGEFVFHLRREAAELDTSDHRASGVRWLMWALGNSRLEKVGSASWACP